MQRRRPPPVAETGRSCWGSGQQDASGAKQTLGTATRAPFTKQCIHVFEITRQKCLVCAGRDEKCREYEQHEEKQNESHDRA